VNTPAVWAAKPRQASTNAASLARARAVLAGGVNSPARSFRSVGGAPRFAELGHGAWLFDVEGRRYLDLVCGWGASIAGHAPPRVVAAVTAAAARGLSFGVPTDVETELAAEVRRRMPHLERLRFTCSGTEAVQSAIRLARAATGRDLVLRFAGGYHGHGDTVLDSPGVPEHLAALSLGATYNDLESVARAFARHPAAIAAVIVEPVAANMGVVAPLPGFLDGLREITVRDGALLIFDEVVTGFRVARGGAAQRYGVTPDLTTLGKIVGGGLPCGAFGGAIDLMRRLAPEGPVTHAGTGAGNPLAMSAGLATLELLDEAAYTDLETHGAHLEAGLRAGLAAASVGASIARVGSMISVFLGVPRVDSWEDARAADTGGFARLFHALLERGVHLPPSPHESWFLSLAHGSREVARLVSAFDSSLRDVVSSCIAAEPPQHRID
jgi:glutamate-1-semialdehyde 2,1-aminomutase